MGFREKLNGFLGREQAAAAEPAHNPALDESGENPFLGRDEFKAMLPKKPEKGRDPNWHLNKQ